MLLEDLVEDLASEGKQGTLLVSGDPGAGKQTALAHLRAVLDAGAAPVGTGTLAEIRLGSLHVVAGPRRPCTWEAALLPWGADEVLEYLQAVHPHACGSVMSRVLENPFAWLPDGSPAVWVLVLDLLASDSDVSSVASALRAHVASSVARAPGDTSRSGLRLGLIDAELRRSCPTLRYAPIRAAWLAASYARFLSRGDASVLAASPCPDFHVLELTAEFLADDAPALACLRDGLAHGESEEQPLAASLLNFLSPGDLRECLEDLARRREPIHLERATLCGFDGHGLDLRGMRAPQATFHGADLRRARLDGLRAPEATFAGARLGEADLSGARAQSASFSCADLTGATLRRAVLLQTDFRGAQAPRADFTGALLRGAQLERADMSGACFDGAFLARTALWHFECRDATFRGADLRAARMAEIRLPGADFTGACLAGADLTGAHLEGAHLHHANLRGSYLAFVAFEGADLRGADFSRAAFHVGSSRSGLVSSPLACEGSRTGFYTDEYDERLFKSPEEIGKANLRCADLRGAVVEDADFYLVDLREARYGARAAAHLRRCGAILADKRA